MYLKLNYTYAKEKKYWISKFYTKVKLETQSSKILHMEFVAVLDVMCP